MNSDFNLSNILTSLVGSQPALWKCPIQQGVPAFINLGFNILMYVAAFAFFFGILLSVYYYLTAFGDDSKASAGLKTLKFTFIGAAVVIISALVINSVVGILAKTGNASYTKTENGTGFILRNQDGDVITPTTNCTEAESTTPTKPSKVDPLGDPADEKKSIQAENEFDGNTELDDSGVETDDSGLFQLNSGSIQS